MKKLLLLFFFLQLGLSAHAASGFVLHRKSGGDVTVLFSVRAEVSYDGTDLVLTTPKATVRYPLSNLESMTFSNNLEAIESVKVVDAQPEKRIYDVSGKLVKTFGAEENVSLDGLPTGVYVVKNGVVNYKIMKK